MDNWTFGWTLALIGMSGTMLVLWILSLLILLIRKVFPDKPSEAPRKANFTSWNPRSFPAYKVFFSEFSNLGLGHVVMILIGSLLLYLGISKGYEPLLLVPIGFGAILVNIPLSEMMAEGGFIRYFYDVGVRTEVFPLLIFIGIGAMTDFQPLLENPKIILLGAAGQFGIFHHFSARSRAWLRQARCRRRFDHRRLRRTDGDLRQLQIRASHARRGFRGSLFVYVVGAAHPAADHARAYHGKERHDRHGRSEAHRSRKRRKSCFPSS